MVTQLEAVESSYSPAMSSMQQDVRAGSGAQGVFLENSYLAVESAANPCSFPALEEARDICIYLKPLQHLLEDMENVEFPEVRGQIGPLMHTVCLVWANCRSFCMPPRLIGLLQDICNLLMQQVSRPTRHCTLRKPDLGGCVNNNKLHCLVGNIVPLVLARLSLNTAMHGTYP